LLTVALVLVPAGLNEAQLFKMHAWQLAGVQGMAYDRYPPRHITIMTRNVSDGQALTVAHAGCSCWCCYVSTATAHYNGLPC